MFYLTTHSTHFIYGYMASDIWLRTILIVRKETRCRHISYSYRLTARVRLYAPSHRQDNTYHGLCYTSRGALAGTRNSSSCNKAIISSVIHPCFSIKPWKCRISNAVAKSGWRRLHRLKCFPAKKPRNEPEARTSEIQSTSGPPEDSTMYPKEAKYIRFCSINSNKI